MTAWLLVRLDPLAPKGHGERQEILVLLAQLEHWVPQAKQGPLAPRVTRGQ